MVRIVVLGMVMVWALVGCNMGMDEPRIVGTATLRPIVTEESSLGRQIFVSRCSTCHGLYGEGDGAVAREARLTPPDFNQPIAITFEEWVAVIQKGRVDKMMPPWEENLTAEELQAVAEYTFRLGKRESP